MVELFQDTDLSHEILYMATIMTSGVVIVVVVVVIIVIICVGTAKFLRMYNFDSPPVGRGAGHGLHDGGERASAELVRHIVVCVDAGELQRREVSVHVSIVFESVFFVVASEPNAISLPSRRIRDSPLRMRALLICVCHVERG